MKYQYEYLKGHWAPEGSICPYPTIMLGKRCAWLAGYHDARHEP